MLETWLDRWKEGRIGWHEAAGNRSLQRHWPYGGRRVLVPFCGKSLDIIWLESRGNEVVGVELSEIAVREFFDDNGLAFRQSADGRRYEALDRRISLVCGDYFEFFAAGFDAHYDRGAIAALPREWRARYAAHTSQLLSADAVQLVIVLEYEQARIEGPPFAVFDDELLSYWPGLERVDAYDDLENGPPKFLDAGLEAMLEVVWRTRHDHGTDATGVQRCSRRDTRPASRSPS